jgi:hypothetical protein
MTDAQSNKVSIAAACYVALPFGAKHRRIGAEGRPCRYLAGTVSE